MLVRMDERQKLLDDLARCLTRRNLTTDEQARDAVDETIREIENRLAELDQKSESDYRRWC
jgi:polyhydroxyalkanoate synthesis regulator phasin